MSLLQTNIELEEVVRVKEPKVVICTFIGTITPSDWENRCFETYVKGQFKDFLYQNWKDLRVYRLIQLIKEQSFDQHVVFENGNVPLVLPFDMFNSNWRQVLESINNYVLWQFTQSKVSPESRCLVNLCLLDGYKRSKINTVLYEDVESTLRYFHSLNIHTVVFSEIETELCRLSMTCTTSGDLSSLIDCFYDESNVGSRMDSKSFDKIATLQQCPKQEILFLSCSGQSISLAHASGFQSVIILRPDNKHTRTFYRLRFPAASTLKAIQFHKDNKSTKN